MGFAFGEILDLPAAVVHVCLICVVIFLLFFDFVTGFLQYAVSDSHELTHMLHHVYKELMLMGIVSFAIIMIETDPKNNNEETHETILSIDFVHIILFYLVIFSILQIFIMMYKSVLMSTKYYRAQNMDLEEFALRIQGANDTSGLHGIKNALSWGIAKVTMMFSLNDLFVYEVKVLQHLFVSTHLLPKNFDFAYYLKECLVKYTLLTYERGLFSWCILLLLGALNWLRVAFDWGLNCHHDFMKRSDEVAYAETHGTVAYSSDHRSLMVEHPPERSEECAKDQIGLFLVLGLLLALCTFGLRILSEYYFQQVFKKAGLNGVLPSKDFIDTIFHASKDEGKSHAIKHFHYKELKSMLANEVHGCEDHGDPDTEKFRLISENFHHFIEASESFFHDLWVAIVTKVCCTFVMKTCGYTAKKAKTEDEKRKSTLARASISFIRAKVSYKEVIQRKEDEHSSIDHMGLKDRIALWRRESADRVKSGLSEDDTTSVLTSVELFKVKKHFMRKHAGGYDFKSFKEADASNEGKLGDLMSFSSNDHMKDMMQIVNETIPDRPKESRNVMYNAIRSVLELLFGKPDLSHLNAEAPWQLSINYTDIFIFNNPAFFHKCVEAVVTLNCAYMAVWACNMITIILDSIQHDFVAYQIAVIIPILINIPNIVMITMKGSVLRAMGEVDAEIMLHTIHEMDATVEARMMVRSKFAAIFAMSKASTANSKTRVIADIFEEADEDGSNEIDKIEFRNLLRKLDIKLDDINFARLYRSMDLDCSGGFSISEFLMLLDDENLAEHARPDYADKRKTEFDEVFKKYDDEFGVLRKTEYLQVDIDEKNGLNNNV